MQDNFRQRYKVSNNKDNIQKAYEYQIGLKQNEDYEKKSENAFVKIAKYFESMYPDVKIESLKGREKSYKSLKNKIGKLEIERLCKLFTIGEITQSEYQDLHLLLKEKTDREHKELLAKIMFEPITNLEDVDEIIKQDTIIEDTKRAILRIVNTKLKNDNNNELETKLDEKYGRKAVEKTKQLKDDLIRWESIEKLDNDKITRKNLHIPFEYLKVKDLRGFRMVINHEGNEVESNDADCIELAQKFANKLINNEELLEKLNIHLLPVGGYKHKEKQNGYMAEHIKFCDNDNEDYTFELQIRTMYREKISKVNGTAAHDKRSGKERVFPNIRDYREIIRQLQVIVPNYTTFEKIDGKYQKHKYSFIENIKKYFEGYEIDYEKYEKVIEYVENEEINNR